MNEYRDKMNMVYLCVCMYVCIWSIWCIFVFKRQMNLQLFVYNSNYELLFQ